MLLARLGVALLLAVVVAAAALLAISWRSEIEPVARPDPASFDPELVARGAVLSAAGNCMLCHTEVGGAAYAGGYAVETPYGDIYGTNITPDEETGIGTWSEAAFIRSMHEGVDRAGRHLYPAFPYTHYTRVTKDDLRAIYAYLMTREPVRAEAPAPEVPFPFTFRPLLAGWKLLFFEEGRFQPVADRDAQWNRGAYLAEGLGHCSAYHTPRNLLGAERQDQLYDGGETEGWHGPALNDLAPGPVPWTAEALMAYLRGGHHPHHGLAAGPMAPITRELATIPEEDGAAMAAYFDELTGPAEEAKIEAALAFAWDREYDVATLPEAARQAEPGSGAAIFSGACASCHVSGSPVIPFGELTPLAATSAVSGPDPRNLIHIILDGIQPRRGSRACICRASPARSTTGRFARWRSTCASTSPTRAHGMISRSDCARSSTTATHRAAAARQVPNLLRQVPLHAGGSTSLAPSGRAIYDTNDRNGVLQRSILDLIGWPLWAARTCDFEAGRPRGRTEMLGDLA